VEEFVILKNIFRNSGQNIDQEMRIHEQNSLLVENNETLANNTGKGHTICNNLRFILWSTKAFWEVRAQLVSDSPIF